MNTGNNYIKNNRV